MPHSFGYRARTRHTFARGFRAHGILSSKFFLTNFKLGDFVTVKVNSNEHKGMPHRIYHGKTGRVWNVTPRAVGVEITKQVRGRIINKRFHVRIEHVVKSKCRQDFLERCKLNNKIALENKDKPVEQRKKFVKRLPAQPRPSFTLKVENVVDVIPPEFVETA
ncbi:60S ribosomal protein L21 [Naegleria gruberi]|uniref:60S ribosomal protein L21 n=1 Tax=Naegleria gruberi TaxID=5762 RepID=D2V6U3_NAEGR|nr:60S ribosomal protein L21 [Naegleria gruberi]EFC47505.1 60S ribosomal protein L21 [Naegleria gruberi]|eukprot:XP_002680249.1 60S ribosomal protein L21 [Naegleria gruberi strain NEG-M]